MRRSATREQEGSNAEEATQNNHFTRFMVDSQLWVRGGVESGPQWKARGRFEVSSREFHLEFAVRFAGVRGDCEALVHRINKSIALRNSNEPNHSWRTRRTWDKFAK